MCLETEEIKSQPQTLTINLDKIVQTPFILGKFLSQQHLMARFRSLIPVVRTGKINFFKKLKNNNNLHSSEFEVNKGKHNCD